MSDTFSTIHTIDQVITALDEIIENSVKDESPLGYFAALYRKVTISVKEGIANGDFEDGPRMEKLDVIFATRYIDAYHAYQQNGQTTQSWSMAFALSESYWPVVLQHLLIGMNAHINLDLGIAAAEVMKGKDINDLKNDFNHINTVLADLVEGMENDLSEIWPTFKKILKWAKGVNTFLVNFGMREARDGAWKFAVALSNESPKNMQKAIKDRDASVEKTAELITSPGWIPSLIFKLIRLAERGSVAEKINDLKD
ncbi:MAG: DUF5995 family protein [Bacteroidota bacterium]